MEIEVDGMIINSKRLKRITSTAKKNSVSRQTIYNRLKKGKEKIVFIDKVPFIIQDEISERKPRSDKKRLNK